MDDSVVGKRGRGRPKLSDSFDRRFRFRANEEHDYMLRVLEDELNKSSGEVLRKALETLYEFVTLN